MACNSSTSQFRDGSIATMLSMLTLTFPWEGGIEENTYLACVFAIRAHYVVTGNLLTREENNHIINIKARCGPGAVWASSSHLSPWMVRSRPPEHRFVSPVIALPGRGVGAWKRDGQYRVPGSGRRAYRPL
jgi:hypothetical protein